MATKYWIGGDGTWDSSTTTNWSDDGINGGAVAPTASDDVIFNVSSDSGAPFTVTLSTGAVCKDVTISGLDQTMTLAGTTAWIISGSLSFPASNLTVSYSGAITFNATTTGKTITTNGISLSSAITFDGVGGAWTLQDALTTTQAITLTNGTIALGSNTLTCLTFASNNSNTRVKILELEKLFSLRQRQQLFGILVQ